MKNFFSKLFTFIKILGALLILGLACKLALALIVPLVAAATLFNLVVWGAMGLGVLALVGFVVIKLLSKGKRKK